MDKYKYFLLLFNVVIILLFWCYFPICFDNNDDFVMNGISAGAFSGVCSKNIVLTNIYIGNFLMHLFAFNSKINWYTFFLQSTLLICFITTCFLYIKKRNVSFITSFLFLFFLFFGLFFLCFIKLQFTTVALFCACVGLLCVINNQDYKYNNVLFALFIIIAFLIRKDTFYIAVFFIVPIFILQNNKLVFIRKYGISVIMIIIVFIASIYFNNSNKEYKQFYTYNNVNAIDIIAARPTKIDNNILKEYKMTVDDIALLQNWFIADNSYLTGKKIETFAKSIQTIRDKLEIKNELKKFILDERYILLVYALSIIFIFFCSNKAIKFSLLNLLFFFFLLLYLTLTIRIPHRVTFPIISYLILANIFYLFKDTSKQKLQLFFLSILFVISIYKAYCTSKLYFIQKENHQIFNAYVNEINQHSNTIFIALDALPVQYIYAWQSPKNIFPAYNVIFGGWYACTPDYNTLLKKHGLKNLTISIKNIQNILFLTNSAALQNAYINVMKQRYNINCHFENVNGFKYFNPKKLVFDN